MFAAVVILLFLAHSTTTVLAVCQYKLPVYGNSNQCANFDLNSIEELPAQNFSTSPGGPMAGIVYLIKVCLNVEFSGIPDVCASKPGYPAYQFDNSAFCYPLGKLDDVFVVRAHVCNLQRSKFLRVRHMLIPLVSRGSDQHFGRNQNSVYKWRWAAFILHNVAILQNV